MVTLIFKYPDIGYARIEDGVWRASNPVILNLVNHFTHPGGADPSDPDPDLTLATQAANVLGATIDSADPPAQDDPEGEYPVY